MRRREDYWDSVLYVFQAKVQDLELQLLKSSTNASAEDSTSTPQSATCLGDKSDEIKKNCSRLSGNSCVVDEKEIIPRQPAGIANESTHVESSKSTGARPLTSPKEKDKEDESLQNPPKVVPAPKEYPRPVWVAQGAIRRRAQLLSLEGKKALVKWQGCDEEETVDMDTVTELVHGNISSNNKQNEEHQNSDDGNRKVPLSDGENSPVRPSTPLKPSSVRRGRSAVRVAKLESTLTAEEPARRNPGMPRKDTLPLAVLQNEQPIRRGRARKEYADVKQASLQEIEQAVPEMRRRPQRDAATRAQQQLVKLGTGRPRRVATQEVSAVPVTGGAHKVVGSEEGSIAPPPAVKGEHRPKKVATLEGSTRRRPGKPQKRISGEDGFSQRVTRAMGKPPTVMTSKESADPQENLEPSRPRNAADGDSPTGAIKRATSRSRKAPITNEARGRNSGKRKTDNESVGAWSPSTGEQSLAPASKRPRRSAAISQKR